MIRVVCLLTLCAPALAAEPVALFDGKDLGRWYTYLRDHGKDKDPNVNFAVRLGVLRISGQDFGGLLTRDEYANYEVTLEYAWGSKVWPPREKTARDSGLLVHCSGPDGAPVSGRFVRAGWRMASEWPSNLATPLVESTGSSPDIQ